MSDAGEVLRLTGADGFVFPAYHVRPTDARRGGLVMLHAVWGVTPHIGALADHYADLGYEVLAPSLLERCDPGFAATDMDEARRAVREGCAEASGWGDTTTGDVQACIDALKGPVFVIGFCFGGTAAWLAACRCEGLAAASCFYGGHIARYRGETPKCPTILHFGRTDELILAQDVAAIEAAHPDLPVWLYDAGHAFVAPSGYHADSARLAQLRTLQLFQRAGGARGEV